MYLTCDKIRLKRCWIVIFLFVADGNDSESASLTEKKKSGPPPNTTTYTVSIVLVLKFYQSLKRPWKVVLYLLYLLFDLQVADRDTLTSVAARFDTTPSELTKLNRLGTPYIFPGQQLYVPQRVKVRFSYTLYNKISSI